MKKYLIILAALFASCGTFDKANRQLRKAERHLNRAIELGAKVEKDTVWMLQEWIIPEAKTDTVLKITHDTVTIEKERLKIKFLVNKVTDSIFVEGRCLPDTVVKKIPVLVEKKIQTGYSTWDMTVLGIVVAVIVFIAGYIYSRVRR